MPCFCFILIKLRHELKVAASSLLMNWRLKLVGAATPSGWAELKIVKVKPVNLVGLIFKAELSPRLKVRPKTNLLASTSLLGMLYLAKLEQVRSVPFPFFFQFLGFMDEVKLLSYNLRPGPSYRQLNSN